MVKPSNWSALSKMWEKKHLKKKEISKKEPACLLEILLWGNFQLLLVQIDRLVFPNGLFQTINGLKRLMTYSKRLH